MPLLVIERLWYIKLDFVSLFFFFKFHDLRGFILLFFPSLDIFRLLLLSLNILCISILFGTFLPSSILFCNFIKFSERLISRLPYAIFLLKGSSIAIIQFCFKHFQTFRSSFVRLGSSLQVLALICSWLLKLLIIFFKF